LGEQIALIMGVERPPLDVVRTLQKIRSKLMVATFPELRIDFGDHELSVTRAKVSRGIVIEWARPMGIRLVVWRGEKPAAQNHVGDMSLDADETTTVFSLERNTNAWTSSRGHLFQMLRAAILDLYRASG